MELWRERYGRPVSDARFARAFALVDAHIEREWERRAKWEAYDAHRAAQEEPSAECEDDEEPEGERGADDAYGSTADDERLRVRYVSQGKIKRII